MNRTIEIAPVRRNLVVEAGKGGSRIGLPFRMLDLFATEAARTAKAA